MFEIKVDTKKKRVIAVLNGLMSDAEVAQVATSLLDGAKRLGPGFDFISDISHMRPLSQKGLAEVRRAAEGLSRMGMRRMVRVVGPSAVAEMQFQRESKQAAGLQAVRHVHSMADAEALLDDPNSH